MLHDQCCVIERWTKPTRVIDLITDGNNMAFVHSVRDGHRSHGQLGFLHGKLLHSKTKPTFSGRTDHYPFICLIVAIIFFTL